MTPLPIEQHLAEVAARNAQRVEAAKAALGKSYVLHPANRVRRITKRKKR